MRGRIVGVDIGGTHVRIGTEAEGGGVSRIRKLGTAALNREGHLLHNLAAVLSDYIKLGGTPIEAVAVGFPSTISRDKKMIIQSPNIKGLDRVWAADELSALLERPVFIEKDVNLLMYHDIEAYSLQNSALCVGIYVGTGIGNAIFVNGKPICSKNGVAGELGHFPLPNGSDTCGCGNVGCLECCASGRYLAELRAGSYPELSFEELFARCDEPIASYIDNIACLIAGEINILDPDSVVLGGGVLTSKGFPKARLRARIQTHLRKPLPAENVELVFSDSSDGIAGAIIYGRQCLVNGTA